MNRTSSILARVRILGFAVAVAGLPLFPVRAATTDEISAAQASWQASLKSESEARLDDAIEQVGAFFDAGGGDYLSGLRLGWLYSQKGEYELAVQSYRLAADAAPRAVTPLKGLLYSYKSLEKNSMANHTAKEILAIDANQYDANLFLGEYYYWRKDYNKAMGYFRRLHALFPEDAIVLHWLGWTYLKRGSETQAKRYFEQAAMLGITHPTVQ